MHHASWMTLALLAGVASAARAGSATADEWPVRVERGPFVIRSEVPIHDREELLKELRQLRDDIESQLGLRTVTDDDGPRIQINLFKSQRTYTRHLAERVPSAANRPACFVQGPDLGRVYIVRRDDVLADIRHETTHALLHQSLPFIPLWLDEGLAMHFEAPRESRSRKPPHLGGLRWQARFGWKPDLADLETREDLSEMKTAGYRQSWAWVHFLLHESDDTNAVLKKYLAEIESGTPPGPLSLRLREGVPDADVRLVRHLETWGR